MGRKTSFVQAIMVADSAIIDSVKSESSLEDEVTSNSKQSTASEQQIVRSEYEAFDDFDFDMDELDVQVSQNQTIQRAVDNITSLTQYDAEQIAAKLKDKLKG